MAAGGSDNATLTDVNRICELFRGRFTEDDITALYIACDRNVQATAHFMLTGTKEEIAARLALVRSNPVTETIVNNLKRMRRRETQKDVLAAQSGQQGRVGTSTRQFACPDCDNMWWRKVPSRKEVSKCIRCREKYDPVPRNREWGIATFECQECGHVFRGYGCMHLVRSWCYNCYALVAPREIHPPTTDHVRRTRNVHSCNAPDCINRQGHAEANPGPGVNYEEWTCVHPASRRARNRPAVIHASQEHVSSGSTVDTFLTQDFGRVGDRVFYPVQPNMEEWDETQASSDDGEGGNR